MKKTLNLLIVISLIFFSCSKDDDSSSNSITITVEKLSGDGWITWEADSWKLNGDEMISQIAFAQEYYTDGNVISAAADYAGYVTYTTDTYTCSGNKINYTSTDPGSIGATTQATVTKISSTELDITISDAGDTHEIKMYKYDSSMQDNNIKAKALEQENNLSFREALNKVKELKTK